MLLKINPNPVEVHSDSHFPLLPGSTYRAMFSAQFILALSAQRAYVTLLTWPFFRSQSS